MSGQKSGTAFSLTSSDTSDSNSLSVPHYTAVALSYIVFYCVFAILMEINEDDEVSGAPHPILGR